MCIDQCRSNNNNNSNDSIVVLILIITRTHPRIDILRIIGVLVSAAVAIVISHKIYPMVFLLLFFIIITINNNNDVNDKSHTDAMWSINS
jgi:hypothetical protein